MLGRRTTIGRMASPRERSPPQQVARDFATTHWSLVIHAGRGGDRAAEEALAVLCERYWYPLYAYVRRRVAQVDEARDLTQEFFAHLLQHETLAKASAERGRFRSFLLTALRNFLANERDRATAKKRGGKHRPLSIDVATGESRLGLEPAHDLTPERIYERQWTLTLLAEVMNQLRSECATEGKERQFELLQNTLTGDRQAAYESIARELGMSEPAARQAAHRLRKRYRELLRGEISQTVCEPGEVDDEIRQLFAALGP
jgi:RNA polymerase sigma factor (sigma-70 family)